MIDARLKSMIDETLLGSPQFAGTAVAPTLNSRHV